MYKLKFILKGDKIMNDLEISFNTFENIKIIDKNSIRKNILKILVCLNLNIIIFVFQDII